MAQAQHELAPVAGFLVECYDPFGVVAFLGLFWLSKEDVGVALSRDEEGLK